MKLEEIIGIAQGELKEYFFEYCEEEGLTNEHNAPCLFNDLNYNGRVHEIIDSSVPIWDSEIKDIFYLSGLGEETEEEFEFQFGVESKTDKEWPNGWKAAAIYSYIEGQLAQWYEENKGLLMNRIEDRQESLV